ncbi:MAG TPA: ShlB/FhaC/HecB family hemolysin secretion/activation protein [Gallionella sp.]|nr:ShlB/FhaC/HecB family hemolysin secretion/activation protein [Gallionella sp.]
MSYPNTPYIRTPLALAALLVVTSVAQAQPDAGTLLQQLEKDQPQLLPRQMAPSKPLEPAPLKAPSGLSVTVKEFRFAGNTLLSAEQLAPAVAPYLNRPLGMDDLRKAAAAVADAYRQAGWIVRTYLPQQDIRDGIVTIQIVEAVFAGAVIESGQPQRYPPAAAIGMIEAAQAKGERLNADAIDRALLLLDDLPGISATGSLRAGQAKGETELALKLADEPLFRSEIGADNTGSRATGPERILANLNVNSPLGKGDALIANAVHTIGSDYIRLAGSLPLGNDGWRAGVNTSYLSYNLVAPEFLALDGKGTSDTVGLDINYPLIRSRMQNLYLSANADHKNFNNKILGAITTRYRSDTISLGLNGNYFDNLGGGGVNSASLAYIGGNLNLNGSPNQAADALTTRTAGRYSKLRYALSRQQVVSETVALYAALSGQRAGKNLDSSEKFYLGGAGGVRAYPSSEAGGADGQMVNLELRWKFSEGYSLTPFYDWGHVRVNRYNNFVGAPALNAYSLSGAGVALGWQAEFGMTAKLTWARRIGTNPNPTATGQDQDGSRIRDRLWASVMLPF